MPPAIFKKYSLILGENTFQSVASTSPGDARRLQSLISSLAGNLEREHRLIPLSSSPFPSPIGFLWQFNVNIGGNDTFFLFAATATTLYLNAPGTTFWNPVVPVGTLVGYPVARNINNMMHFTDGAKNWIFDGASWVQEGLALPPKPPKIQGFSSGSGPSTIASISRSNSVVSVQTSGSGTPFQVGLSVWMTITGATDPTFNAVTLLFTGTGSKTATATQTGPDSGAAAGGTLTTLNPTILSNRYYRSTYLDQSATHGHESSSSPISFGTGPATNSVLVRQRAGSATWVSGSTAVVGAGTDWSSQDVGMVMYIAGQAQTIATVTDAQHLTLQSPATANATSAFLIAPIRATAWNLYASSSEEDKNCNLLATIPIDTNPIHFSYTDQSPMIGTAGSYFNSVITPLLNDPPNPTTRMDVHKNRLWRRDETRQNFFSYTGFEEIAAEQAGSPYESVPGAAGDLTVSTQENETSMPDQSLHIRGLCAHGDSLYIGSEKNVYPLYGSSLQDFGLSQVEVFAVGFAGRSGQCTTPFGLAFVSYDTKVYLYPSQYEFQVESTTALIELGRPKRPEFQRISNLDQVQLIFYNWGRRNWLVLTYQRTDASWATWVFDFETKGWFQLQQGYTAIVVYEVTPGRKCLVGAALDNNIYVIDDLTASFAVPDGMNFPPGTYRQVVDFGEPNAVYTIGNIEFEVSDPELEVDVTVWLDPQDPDDPGDGIPVAMTQKTIGAGGSVAGTTLSTRYSGRLNATTGATCQRLLIEFSVAANTVDGVFRGLTIEAEKMTSDVVL